MLAPALRMYLRTEDIGHESRAKVTLVNPDLLVSMSEAGNGAPLTMLTMVNGDHLYVPMSVTDTLCALTPKDGSFHGC